MQYRALQSLTGHNIYLYSSLNYRQKKPPIKGAYKSIARFYRGNLIYF